MSLLRLSLADAAELIEEQASGAKETLRQMEDEVQAGERDTLGRSKKRLEEEKDVKVAWEHGMDTVKGAGSKVIGATQQATAKAEETTKKTADRLSDAFAKVSLLVIRRSHSSLTKPHRLLNAPSKMRSTRTLSIPFSPSCRSESTRASTPLQTRISPSPSSSQIPPPSSTSPRPSTSSAPSLSVSREPLLTRSSATSGPLPTLSCATPNSRSGSTMPLGTLVAA